MDEQQARVLVRLRDRYADALPRVRDRDPEASIAVLLHAVHAHQARRLFASDRRWRETTGITERPEDRPDDVIDALTLLRVARADLDSMEAALLLAARLPAADTGKPLLTFKTIAAALGVDSEQAAQGRYRRKVGNLNGSDAGADGTP